MKHLSAHPSPPPHMDDTLLVSQLEAVARTLCITVRREPIDDEEISSTGGLCRVQDQHLIIIDTKASPRQQAAVLATALKHFDVSRIYLRPGVRAFLETAQGNQSIGVPRERL